MNQSVIPREPLNSTIGINQDVYNHQPEIHYHLLESVLLSAILIFLCIATVVGNLLVILAVLLVPKLQRPENLLIINLAIADELVGLLVMPVALIYEVWGYWPFGSIICNLWISLDITACSASILGLCAISLDRYLVISRPLQYGPKRTLWRMVSAAILVWILSIIISVPPLFYFGNQTFQDRCLVSQDLAYQIYATITAFYAPVLLMCIAYGKIYQAAAKISREEKSYAVIQPLKHAPAPKTPLRKKNSSSRQLIRILVPANVNSPLLHHVRPVTVNRTTSSFSSRELKAFKTLTAIVFAFLVSWLPFFVVALIRPFCIDSIPKWVSGLTVWLGWCNSTINPILYSIFNKDFRRPFAELLRCRCRSLRKIMRTESYETQFGMVVMRGSRSPPSSSPEPRPETRTMFYLCDSASL